MADVDPHGVEEGVRHPAANHQRVDLGDEIFKERDLGRHLGAADDGHHRPLRLAERLLERGKLALHRAAREGRQTVGEALGGAVGAVGGGEGVVDVKVAVLGERVGKGAVVLFLALVEAGVFEEQHGAVLERGDGLAGGVADAVLGERDGAADFLGERVGDRAERHLGVALALRPAEVREEDHLGALVRELGDGRRDGVEAGAVADLAVRHGDVEVHAGEDALAGHVADVVEPEDVHSERSFLRRIQLSDGLSHVSLIIALRSISM